LGIKLIASNKKAYHDYYIEETFEAGIVLLGSEVKSLRLGNINLKDCFCRIKDGEVWLNNAHISPYEMANRENHDPTRVRKLLLHAREIDKLIKKVDTRGFSLVPTRIYFKNSLIKVELGLAKGKQTHDKRQSLKEKEASREMARAMKERDR